MEVLLVTRYEAARMLSISVDTLDRLRFEGKLKPVFIKSRVYYSVAALKAFVTKEGFCAE